MRPAAGTATAVPQDLHTEQLLLVERTTWEAAGVLSLQLVAPNLSPLPAWTPGAHLDVVLPSGLVRQYSLCGDPLDFCRYRIAVQLDEHGRGGSREIHGSQLVGRTLRVRGPRNHFRLEPAPGYLFLAGGIGITPLLSMAREAGRRGLPWRLAYGGRTAASMPFVTELAALPGGQVEVVAQDVRGVLDLTTLIGSATPDTAVYACGPEPMLQAAEAAASSCRPARTLHLERFAAAASVDFTPPTPAGTAPVDFEVELRRSARTVVVPPNRSVLAVVREVVPDVLYSCEEGFCGACETSVLEGEPDHRDSILSEQERSCSASMMICVSRSRSRRLVLDI